jgi:hypothetical protein
LQEAAATKSPPASGMILNLAGSNAAIAAAFRSPDPRRG